MENNKNYKQQKRRQKVKTIRPEKERKVQTTNKAVKPFR
jgi:hypothetical protein